MELCWNNLPRVRRNVELYTDELFIMKWYALLCAPQMQWKRSCKKCEVQRNDIFYSNENSTLSYRYAAPPRNVCKILYRYQYWHLYRTPGPGSTSSITLCNKMFSSYEDVSSLAIGCCGHSHNDPLSFDVRRSRYLRKLDIFAILLFGNMKQRGSTT